MKPQDKTTASPFTPPHVFRDPAGANVMVAVGVITFAGAFICWANGEVVLGAAGLIGGVLYFAIANAFTLLARNTHFGEIACWHLHELRRELAERAEPILSPAPPAKPAGPVAVRDEPYRL
jgi:hypothetical protein